jgi:succinate-semialdehyde dehydrogenase/glutarate-semialdehyde dehydrogenase
MEIMTSETFGPVAPVCRVADFDEALTVAGADGLGLSACVLSTDRRRIMRAVHDLDVGTVKVGAAFGGAPGGSADPRRGSGLGHGFGPELLDELTVLKVVHDASANVPPRTTTA